MKGFSSRLSGSMIWYSSSIPIVSSGRFVFMGPLLGWGEAASVSGCAAEAL